MNSIAHYFLNSYYCCRSILRARDEWVSDARLWHAHERDLTTIRRCGVECGRTACTFSAHTNTHSMKCRKCVSANGARTWAADTNLGSCRGLMSTRCDSLLCISKCVALSVSAVTHTVRGLDANDLIWFN